MISYGTYEKFKWINGACCPPNVVRMIASLGGYIYAKTPDEIYVNLFIGSRAKTNLGKTAVEIAQETRYPWEGKTRLTVSPERSARFALNLRIPGWAQNQPLP